MSKSTLFSIISAITACLGPLQAADRGETRVKMADLPPAVKKTVQEVSKGAALRGLAKEVEDGKTFYEAELKVNGHTKDVLIDPSGAVVEIEEEVALASLPAPVKAALEREAGKGKILLVESITKGGAITAYEAKIKTGGKTAEVRVAPDGSPAK